MADTDTPDTEAPAAKPATRRRSTTPAKAAAAKPRATRARKTDGEAAPAKAKPKAPPKPRSTKRTATPPSVTARTRTAAKQAGDAIGKATEKVGGAWGAAAIGAGVAVAGAAAAAAVLSFRKANPPADPATKGAHQADGTDSSASFKAGIADEGSVPN